jgi:hypothetical protein
MLFSLAVKLNILTFATCSSIKDVKGGSFFLLPPWWEYVKNVETNGLGECVPKYTFPADVLNIGFALIDILLRLAGFLAIVGIIIGGINYIIAIGDPGKITSARRSIINSLIGLTIALVAIAVVQFIGTKVGG